MPEIRIFHHSDADIPVLIYNLQTDDGLLEDGLKLYFTVKKTEQDINDDQAIFPQKTSDDPTQIDISSDAPGDRTTPGVCHVFIKPADTVDLPQVNTKYIADMLMVGGDGRQWTVGKIDFWVDSTVTSSKV